MFVVQNGRRLNLRRDPRKGVEKHLTRFSPFHHEAFGSRGKGWIPRDGERSPRSKLSLSIDYSSTIADISTEKRR